MSQHQSTTVTCPQCGHSQDFLTWPSLNVSLDPDEKPRLLNGELHRFTCGKCSARTEVAYPLLFHDMDRKLMIYNIEEVESPEEFPDGMRERSPPRPPNPTPKENSPSSANRKTACSNPTLIVL